MSHSWFITVTCLLLASAFVQVEVQAQTLEERIAHARSVRSAETREQARQQAEARAVLMQRLQRTVENVDVKEAPLSAVLVWYQRTTGVTVVVNWRALEAAGVDRRQPVSLALDRITAGRLLAVLMQSMQADEPVVYEMTPWYVQLLPRSQALQRPVVRVYDVMDLVMSVPDFEAPEFDLTQILEAEGDAAQLFEQDSLPPIAPDDEQHQRGEQLAQLVAQTIEPDIWQRHGGAFSSIRYRAGMLIVRAPLFVQRQIGRPTALSTGPPAERENPRETE